MKLGRTASGSARHSRRSDDPSSRNTLQEPFSSCPQSPGSAESCWTNTTWIITFSSSMRRHRGQNSSHPHHRNQTPCTPTVTVLLRCTATGRAQWHKQTIACAERGVAYGADQAMRTTWPGQSPDRRNKHSVQKCVQQLGQPDILDGLPIRPQGNHGHPVGTHPPEQGKQGIVEADAPNDGNDGALPTSVLPKSPFINQLRKKRTRPPRNAVIGKVTKKPTREPFSELPHTPHRRNWCNSDSKRFQCFTTCNECSWR